MFFKTTEDSPGIFNTDYAEETGFERGLPDSQAAPYPGFGQLVDKNNQQPDTAEDDKPPLSQLAVFLSNFSPAALYS